MTLTKKEVNFIQDHRVLKHKIPELNEIRNDLISKYTETGPHRFRVMIYDKRTPDKLDEIYRALKTDDKKTIDEYTTIHISPWFVAGLIGVIIFVTIALTVGREKDLLWWIFGMLSGLTAISFTIVMCDEFSNYEE